MTRWSLGMKNLYTGEFLTCNLANSEKFCFCWRILDACANSGCLCELCFWQHDVWENLKWFGISGGRTTKLPRHFIRDPGAWKDTLAYTPKGGDEMRWDEMNRDMWLPCMQHDLVTYPRKRMTWHDKRQAGSWVSRIPYREQVQVHASMNPSTTSSIASLGNIGRWAVAPLLVPFDSGLSTHTYVYICVFYRHMVLHTICKHTHMCQCKNNK